MLGILTVVFEMQSNGIQIHLTALQTIKRRRKLEYIFGILSVFFETQSDLDALQPLQKNTRE